MVPTEYFIAVRLERGLATATMRECRVDESRGGPCREREAVGNPPGGCLLKTVSRRREQLDETDVSSRIRLALGMLSLQGLGYWGFRALIRFAHLVIQFVRAVCPIRGQEVIR